MKSQRTACAKTGEVPIADRLDCRHALDEIRRDDEVAEAQRGEQHLAQLPASSTTKRRSSAPLAAAIKPGTACRRGPPTPGMHVPAAAPATAIGCYLMTISRASHPEVVVTARSRP